jgi:hypothetical protein
MITVATNSVVATQRGLQPKIAEVIAGHGQQTGWRAETPLRTSALYRPRLARF